MPRVADPKQDEGFKVVDRRLFTEQGELRSGAIEQERREEEAEATKASALAAAKAKAAPPTPAPVAGGQAAAAPAEAIAPSRSFQMLVDFLTRNAAAMMGGMADPRQAKRSLIWRERAR